jgi:ataxia telangiectasia mutated family protein
LILLPPQLASIPLPHKPARQVPFRLTRDVVDGMGAFGVEGPMRRCCEETLRVRR